MINLQLGQGEPWTVLLVGQLYEFLWNGPAMSFIRSSWVRHSLQYRMFDIAKFDLDIKYVMLQWVCSSFILDPVSLLLVVI